MQTKRFNQHLAPAPSSSISLLYSWLHSSPTTPEGQGDGAMGSVHKNSSLLLLHPMLLLFSRADRPWTAPP